jgi:hypothetical protein
LYFDNTYGLREKPSSDYHEIIDNALTGWTEEDERRVDEWMQQR